MEAKREIRILLKRFDFLSLGEWTFTLRESDRETEYFLEPIHCDRV